jgi:hypothetical protein
MKHPKYIVLNGEGGYSEFDTIAECRSFIAEIGRPFTKIYRQMTLEEERIEDDSFIEFQQNRNAVRRAACETFANLFSMKETVK